MRKLCRAIVLVIALLSPCVAAQSAPAWTTNGPVPFTATAPALTIAISSVPPVTLQCNGSPNKIAGVLNASSPTSPFLVTTVTETIDNCPLIGTAFFVSCTTSQMWATAYAAGTTTAERRNITCTLTFPPFPACVVTLASTGPSGRAWIETYQNATSKFTRQVAGQTLTATWNAACTFFATAPGSAPATITGAFSSALVHTVSAGPAPVITNP